MTFCRLNRQANRSSWYDAPKTSDSYKARPAGRSGTEVAEHGHHVGTGARMVVDHVVHLAVDAAIDRMNQAVAAARLRDAEKRSS